MKEEANNWKCACGAVNSNPFGVVHPCWQCGEEPVTTDKPWPFPNEDQK